MNQLMNKIQNLEKMQYLIFIIFYLFLQIFPLNVFQYNTYLPSKYLTHLRVTQPIPASVFVPIDGAFLQMEESCHVTPLTSEGVEGAEEVSVCFARRDKLDPLRQFPSRNFGVK